MDLEWSFLIKMMVFFRGNGALVIISDKRQNQTIIEDRAATFYSFSKEFLVKGIPLLLWEALHCLNKLYWMLNGTNKQTKRIKSFFREL